MYGKCELRDIRKIDDSVRVVKSYRFQSCHGKSEPNSGKSYGRAEEEACIQRGGWSRYEVRRQETSYWIPEEGRKE